MIANSLHSLEQVTPEEESSTGSNGTLAESLKTSVQASTGSFLLLLMESFQSRPQPDLMFRLADYDLLCPSQTCSVPPAHPSGQCHEVLWKNKMDGSRRANSEPGVKAELI